MVAPTVELAKCFSRQRIAPLIENTSVLMDSVSDPRQRVRRDREQPGDRAVQLTQVVSPPCSGSAGPEAGHTAAGSRPPTDSERLATKYSVRAVAVETPT